MIPNFYDKVVIALGNFLHEDGTDQLLDFIGLLSFMGLVVGLIWICF